MTELRAVGSPFPATPPKHGLRAAATETQDPSRWELGFTVQPENCVNVNMIDPDCTVWPGGNKPDVALTASPDNMSWYNVDPYVIDTSFECAATGFSTQDFPGRARRQLEAATDKALEYELWSGELKNRTATAAAGTTGTTVVASASVFSTDDVGRWVQVGSGTITRIVSRTSATTVETQAAHGGSSGNTIEVFSPNPTLTLGAVVVNPTPGTGVSVARGFSLLAAALSDCYHGGRGVIHAPAWVVDYYLATSGSGIKENGDRLETVARGDFVVAGVGYPGTAPGNRAPAAGNVWVYATGPVNYRLGEAMILPDTMREALDRSKNKVEYRAERMAAATFDPCCHFGVEITIA